MENITVERTFRQAETGSGVVNDMSEKNTCRYCAQGMEPCHATHTDSDKPRHHIGMHNFFCHESKSVRAIPADIAQDMAGEQIAEGK